jgi:hypothetical protein
MELTSLQLVGLGILCVLHLTKEIFVTEKILGNVVPAILVTEDPV